MPVPDDLADGSTGTDRLSAMLPTLTPLLVAGEEEIDQVDRTARAGIAILSLQLRTVERSASLAEAQETNWDLHAAQGFLQASLGHRMEMRRREMAEEVEQVRGEAVRLVLQSRATAADLIAKAGEESLALLMAGTGVDRTSGAPSLRIISQRRTDPAGQDLHALTHPFDHPASDAARTSVAGRIVAPVVAPIPVVLPPDAERTSTPVTPPPAPSASATATVSTPVVVVPTTLADPGVSEEPKPQSPLSRFLYLDVLLPMIAVLILIVVLLAWVG